MRLFIALLALIAVQLTGPLAAQSGMPPAPYAYTQLEDPALEAEATALMHTLRCLKCQSQSIADSDAPMAGDMRHQVRSRLLAGESADEVRDWLTQRYGDYVSYEPTVSSTTWPLFAIPLLLLALVGLVLLRPSWQTRLTCGWYGMIGQWLAILALTLVSFAIAAFYLRMPKQGFAVFGAALLLGLVGYTWAGSPGQRGSPKQPETQVEAQSGEEMVEARLALFDPSQAKPDYLTLSDGFARRGKFDQAAALLRKGLRENPNHLEGWLALGMALTGHAEGFVTPAANYAYGKAREIDPSNPGPDFFLGTSLLQTGQIVAARDIWGRLLENSPDDAPWKEEIENRVARLDQMIANAPMLQ